MHLIPDDVCHLHDSSASPAVKQDRNLEKSAPVLKVRNEKFRNVGLAAGEVGAPTLSHRTRQRWGTRQVNGSIWRVTPREKAVLVFKAKAPVISRGLNLGAERSLPNTLIIVRAQALSSAWMSRVTSRGGRGSRTLVADEAARQLGRPRPVPTGNTLPGAGLPGKILVVTAAARACCGGKYFGTSSDLGSKSPHPKLRRGRGV